MDKVLAQKPKFSVAITTEKYQQLINNTLGNPERAKRFIAAITSSVAVNPDLQQCDAGTILAGALLGESLNLSPSPQLGQYYLIPFDCKLRGEDGKILYQKDENGQYIKDDNGRRVPIVEKRAQFCMGYKGYIQLALRSGMLKKFIVMEVKDGELISWDPFNDALICAYNTDPCRDEIKTIGYMARAEYLGGYEATLFWTRKQMIKHADTYVPAFSAESFSQLENNQIPDNEKWKYSSKWYTNFDLMAKKTMIRQLLSKKALITPRTDLFEAFEKDNHAITFDKNDGFISLDNTPPMPEPTSLPLPNAVTKVNLNDI